MTLITQEAVNAGIEPAELARIAGEARAELAELSRDEALDVIYIRCAVAERQAQLTAEWMDATRKTVEGFVKQLQGHPMFALMGDNPFGA